MSVYRFLISDWSVHWLMLNLLSVINHMPEIADLQAHIALAVRRRFVDHRSSGRRQQYNKVYVLLFGIAVNVRHLWYSQLNQYWLGHHCHHCSNSNLLSAGPYQYPGLSPYISMATNRMVTFVSCPKIRKEMDKRQIVHSAMMLGWLIITTRGRSTRTCEPRQRPNHPPRATTLLFYFHIKYSTRTSITAWLQLS